MEARSQIKPEIAQEVFESAANASEKGQSAFYTPLPFAQTLAAGLPKVRLAPVDLNCGSGNLLQASATAETSFLFGTDIDPCRERQKSEGRSQKADGASVPSVPSVPAHSINRITGDLCRLYPLFKEVGLEADLFTLNPPWRLYWYRERLAALANSDLAAVRMAFQAKESRATGMPDACIDSTIATLLMALDLCTVYGEGYLIANNATLERLLFAEGAVHSAVAKHIWLHVIVPGNPMTGLDVCKWHDKETADDRTQEFKTGIIYFAREHTTGPKTLALDLALNLNLEQELSSARLHRHGAEIRSPYLCTEDLPELWQAVKEKWGELEGNKPKVPWNLWLTAGGRIRTALSLFERKSGKVNKAEVERLYALNEKAPMELVLQRNQRDELLHVAQAAGWRVQPELLAAVDKAIHDYHAARAPLYPLPEIQRLGYLDEQNEIECKLDLSLNAERGTRNAESEPVPSVRSLVFQAGYTYLLRTQTVSVTRKVTKPNPFTGENEELEFTGQQLAIFLSDAPKKNGQFVGGKTEEESDEWCFMDATLKADPNTKVHTAKRQKKTKSRSTLDPQPSTVPIDFTLQQLCAHFIIPDVPDVATVNPDGYRQYVDQLTQLEHLTEEAA